MFGWANVGPTDAHWLGQRWHQPLAQRCFGRLPLRWPNGDVSPLGQRPANVGPIESSTTLGQRLTIVVMLFLFIVFFNSCIYFCIDALVCRSSFYTLPSTLSADSIVVYTDVNGVSQQTNQNFVTRAVSEYTAWLSNYIQQYSVGCNCLAIHTCL